MKRNITIIISNIVFSLAILPNVNAQSKIEIEEKKSGYKGDFNRHVTVLEDGFSFLALGDFGRVGAYFQKETARELGKTAIAMDAAFIISVGDNFYPNGVASTEDPHWQKSFEDIYTHPNLFEDWYVALGNHDYRGNIQAQIDYTKISRRWYMPAPYYSKTFQLNDGKKLLLVVMDTNPFIDAYHDNYEKYPALQEQDTMLQREWLSKTLNTGDTTITWKIVVGHHPLYSGGKRKNNKDTKSFEEKFASFFDLHGVNAYICGHEHDLQIIRPSDRNTIQFLSGAASEIRPSGERAGTLFAKSAPGFMAFTIQGKQLLVQTIEVTEDDSKMIYQYKLEK